MDCSFASPALRSSPSVQAAPGGVTWIYALCDDDMTPRYVGSTVNPHKRLRQHWQRSTRHTPRKTAWRASRSSPPRFVILETVASDSRAAAEARWIARFARRFDLVNQAKPKKSPEYVRHAPVASEEELRASSRAQSGLVLTKSEAGMICGLALRRAMRECGVTMFVAASEMGLSEEAVRRRRLGRCWRGSAWLRSPALRDDILGKLLRVLRPMYSHDAPTLPASHPADNSGSARSAGVSR